MQQNFPWTQENLISIELYDILTLSRDIDPQILALALRILEKKSENQDCSQFLNSNEIHLHISNLDLSSEENALIVDLNRLITLIKVLIGHDFNKTNYSKQIYYERRKQLVNKISKDIKLIEFLKFIVHLSALDETFIQCSSNALNLLVEMRISLSKQDWQNIKIQKTSIVGANFAKSNLSRTEFDNVRMDGVNLSGAILFHCIWKNMVFGELYGLYHHQGPINQVCYSPDGLTFVSASDDGSIILWDVKGVKQTLKLKMDGVISLNFSPDNATLVSGNDKGKIYIWNVRQGKIKQILNGHTDEVNSVRFSPDGATMASGSRDKSIRLWDMMTGELKSELNGHTCLVSSVSFSPDGITLASGSWDNSIRLWDVNTGKIKWTHWYWLFTLRSIKYFLQTITKYVPKNLTLLKFYPYFANRFQYIDEITSFNFIFKISQHSGTKIKQRKNFNMFYNDNDSCIHKLLSQNFIFQSKNKFDKITIIIQALYSYFNFFQMIKHQLKLPSISCDKFAKFRQVLFQVICQSSTMLLLKFIQQIRYLNSQRQYFKIFPYKFYNSHLPTNYYQKTIF